VNPLIVAFLPAINEVHDETCWGKFSSDNNIIVDINRKVGSMILKLVIDINTINNMKEIENERGLK
jgi:hypothetical protein